MYETRCFESFHKKFPFIFLVLLSMVRQPELWLSLSKSSGLEINYSSGLAAAAEPNSGLVCPDTFKTGPYLFDLIRARSHRFNSNQEYYSLVSSFARDPSDCSDFIHFVYVSRNVVAS